MTDDTNTETETTESTDDREQASIDVSRGIPQSLKDERDATVADLFDHDEHADVVNAFRFPDADEAAAYFDSAEQYSGFEVEVEYAGVEAKIIGELGYQWDAVVETDGGLAHVFPEYELAIDGGYVTDKDELGFTVRYPGLWSDHGLFYEKVRDLLEQVANFDPPRHRQQAFTAKMAAETRRVTTDDEQVDAPEDAGEA